MKLLDKIKIWKELLFTTKDSHGFIINGLKIVDDSSFNEIRYYRYKNGKLHGDIVIKELFTSYFYDTSVYEYEDGKMNGRHTQYYKNKIVSYVTYKDDVLEGDYYFCRGKIMKIENWGKYVRGKKEGYEREYYDNTLRCEYLYEDGEIIIEKVYNDNGELDDVYYVIN